MGKWVQIYLKLRPMRRQRSRGSKSTKGVSVKQSSTVTIALSSPFWDEASTLQLIVVSFYLLHVYLISSMAFGILRTPMSLRNCLSLFQA